MLTCSAHEAPEILQRPEAGMDRLVPALLAPDGVGAARVVGTGFQGVVPTLAVGLTDGVYGGQIHHVKAHPRYLRQALLGLLKCRAPARLRPLRAGEARTPGTEEGPVAGRS